MSLNQFAAEKRLAIFEDLRQGLEPREGEFDSATLREARTKGAPQMGTTLYSPSEITFEFIYPDPTSTALILSVRLPSPQRIVFLPVPEWVVENIWQGDVAGSYHFESDAMVQMDKLRADLEAGANEKWFGRQPAKRRE